MPRAKTVTLQRKRDGFWVSCHLHSIRGRVSICNTELYRFVHIPKCAERLHFTVVDKPEKDTPSIMPIEYNGYRFSPPAYYLMHPATEWLEQQIPKDIFPSYFNPYTLYVQIEWS